MQSKQCTSLIIFTAFVYLTLAPAAVTKEKARIYRSSNQSIFSSCLGAETIPAYVQIGKTQHKGLFIKTKPSASLGISMGLASGAVLLSLDGYSMSSSKEIDDWIGRRPKKPMLFSYVVVQDGIATFYTSQIENTPGPGASTSSNQPLPPASGAGGTRSIDEIEKYILTLVNSSRRSESLPEVRQDSALSRLARNYAEYMEHHPEHYVTLRTSPHIDLEGRFPMQRALEAGITTIVHENLGMKSRVQDDLALAQSLHQQMMSEPKGQHNHRSIILDNQATKLGVGAARDKEHLFIVEEFGY